MAFGSLGFSDVKDEFSDQVRPRALDERNIDKDRVEQLDLLYISSLFDLSEWWNIVGRKCLNLMFLLVPKFIAIPPSNGHQKRVFSSYTWFDNPLQQSQKDEKYEMKVLMCVNDSLKYGGQLVDPLVQWVPKPKRGRTQN